MNKSLGQRILEAKDHNVVTELLREGSGYKTATPATRRRWVRLANRRINELS